MKIVSPIEAGKDRARNPVQYAVVTFYLVLLDVMFEMKDGSVTLTVTVPHSVIEQSIEESAAGCPCVTHVANHLQVAFVEA